MVGYAHDLPSARGDVRNTRAAGARAHQRPPRKCDGDGALPASAGPSAGGSHARAGTHRSIRLVAQQQWPTPVLRLGRISNP